jgi:thiol-disulfide isomerase/thioredoxin
MKRSFILCVFAIISLYTSAQTVPEPKVQGKMNMDELEVRDSSGILYPRAIWQKLMLSGKYGLKLSQDHKTGFLTKLSEAEIDARTSKLPRPVESKFFKTGEKIAAFNERDMRGIKHNLKEMAGKVVVLNFWFVNCPPCRQEIPQLNEVVEAYRNNSDVVFIAVALDEKYEIEEFLKTSPFNYHIIDRGRYIASKYGITSYPTHVVLDKEGKVIFHTSGLGMSTVPWLKKSIEAGLNDMAAK